MLVIPVYNIILAPNALVYFSYEQLQRSAGGKSISEGDKVYIIVAKENQNFADLDEDSFYPIGVAGTIAEVNKQGFVSVRTHYRINLESVAFNADHTIQLMASSRPETKDLERDVELAKLQNLKEEMRKYASGYRWADAAEYWLDQIDSINLAACAMSPWLKIENEERYAILAEDSALARAELIEKVLYDFLEVGRITNEAVTSQQQEHQQILREQAIKRQMEHLQKELDEMHPENVTDVQKFAQKIADSGMNETARKEAEKVLNRLKQEGKESVESGILYDYLDFVTGLSWKKEQPEYIDLKEARRILDEDHYGLKKVKDRVIQQIAVMNLKKQQSGSILLFVGAPGTGKTSIGKSIARALGREYVRVSLGGVHDESDIRGHRRTYIGAMPGRIMDGIQKSGVSNPVMVLDEVDKLSASYNGSPASALLEVLDPEQNNTFTDHYLNVPYDLSDVLFICTANTLDSIPAPLLDRMEIIEFNGYTAADKFQIAKRHLLPKARAKMGIKAKDMTVTDSAIRSIISNYTMEGGVRGLQKRLETLCRSAAVEIAKGRKTTLRITNSNLQHYMDMHPIHHEHVLAQKKPGVVTGLAWTQAGGEILFIESLLTVGSGRLIVTGQLGDVMKESVQIALSLVKAMFPKEAEQLKDHDLHVHVPEGAAKKDGPSAGITLTTALASLLTGKRVSSEYAMTGEVSLRGNVMPIGGLPEKLMAAQRAGVKTVFIPKDNVDDLDEVPEEVKKKLNIVPVSEVKDVLKAVGILDR